MTWDFNPIMMQNFGMRNKFVFFDIKYANLRHPLAKLSRFIL